jgi:hypothetical protein
MTEPKISDIPSIKERLEQAKGMVALNRALPFVSPFLRFLGMDTEKMKEALGTVDDLAKQMQDLSLVPDRFNDHFSKLGWIVYESMNLDIAYNAVAKADEGNINEAEQILVDYYSPERVRLHLNQMKAVKAFQPRITLALLALEDYQAARYHACVPVVLALMDGMVNEINENRGFFSDATELTAWDSISAHKKGLVELGKIFKIGRNKTRTEQITIPYRNGILHGNDLGYNNQIVAAKTWAALFAVRDWAIKAENKQLEAPPIKPKPTWKELFNQLQNNGEYKRKLEEWKPRVFGIDKCHISENTDDYPLNSPERKLVQFLTLWKSRNYGKMAEHVPVEWRSTPNAMPKHIRETFGETKLVGFEIVNIVDKAAATTTVNVKLKYEYRDKSTEKEYRFRLLYLNSEGKGEVRGVEGCDWYVMDWKYFNPS